MYIAGWVIIYSIMILLLQYLYTRTNLNFLHTIGLPALLPDFMKGPEYRARMAERRERDDYKSSDSSESDEEWTPSMNRKKAKGNLMKETYQVKKAD